MEVDLYRSAYYLPDQILSNDDLLNEFPNFDAKKIRKKLGIEKRHIASTKITALDMAEKAAARALKGVNKMDVDFVLLCTQSPDYFLPTSACILQDRLGLSKNIGALDFNLGCSGFIYGLSLAKGLIVSGTASNVLLVVSETYSKHMHAKDKSNRAIFGDGAAAVLLRSSNHEGVGQFVLGTDGSGYDKLIVRNGAFRHVFDQNVEEYSYGTDNITSNNCLYMAGPDIFNFTIETVPKVITEVLEKNHLERAKVDQYIYHQANKYMLDYLRRKQGIVKDRFYINMVESGNTVSATIPIALNMAYKDGSVKAGDNIVLCGFGVGLSWGATAIKLPMDFSIYDE